VRAGDCVGTLTLTEADVQVDFSAPSDCASLNGRWVRVAEKPRVVRAEVVDAGVRPQEDACERYRACVCALAELVGRADATAAQPLRNESAPLGARPQRSAVVCGHFREALAREWIGLGGELPASCRP
jgi:hypothetical protein